MIDLSNPLHHYNQLNFNLDASSNSASMDGFMNPPQCVVIQKLKAPEKTAAEAPKNNAFYPRDDRFALAVKLAKLDVNNGVWSDEKKESVEEKAEVKPSKTVKTPLLYGAEKRRPLVNRPSQKAQPLKRTQKATSAPKISKPAISQQRSFRKPNNVRFQQEPTVFQRLTKDINIPYQVPRSLFEPVRDGNVNIMRTKDASTSMSDQISVIIPTKYKNLKSNAIVKAKLTGKKNAKPANRSGFLSFYRTPQRKANTSQFTNPAVSVPVANERPIRPKSYSSTPKVGHSRPPVTFHSPPTKLTETMDESLYSEDKEVIRPKPDLAQYLDDTDSITGEPPVQNNAYSRDADSVAREKPSRSNQNAIKKKVKSDVKSQRPVVPKLDVQTLQNLPTLESLLDKLNAMEQEEMEIRARWKTIVYDDDVKSETNNNPGFLSPKPQPEVVEINASSKDPTAPDCLKKSVRFETSNAVPQSTSAHYIPSASAKSSKIKLGLPDNVIECILDSKKSYNEYLKMSHHEPKGNFDPWKIAEDLSNELLSDILTSVCDEVGSAFDGCIDRVFESEFAQPDSSGSFQLSVASETSYC